MISNFEELIAAAKKKGKMRIALAVAEDQESLEALQIAHNEGLADPILVGDKEKILTICQTIGLDQTLMKIHNEPDPIKATQVTVDLVRSGEASAIMKGLIDTSKLLKAILDKEKGLRAAELLSHVIAFTVPAYHKILVLSDVAMVIAPDLAQKILIIQNAVKVSKALGVEKPKVAMLCAVEKVNYEHMPATVDAAVISKMAERGQLGDMFVDGPLALDLAVSAESCKIKHIVSSVAGDADVLIVPEIVAGNVFYKAITQFQPQHKAAGIVMGAKCPVVLLSRSDSADSKFYSIALASLLT